MAANGVCDTVVVAGIGSTVIDTVSVGSNGVAVIVGLVAEGDAVAEGALVAAWKGIAVNDGASVFGSSVEVGNGTGVSVGAGSQQHNARTSVASASPGNGNRLLMAFLSIIARQAPHTHCGCASRAATSRG